MVETVDLKYEDAIAESNVDRHVWRASAADESESLIANGTWTLVERRKGMRVIPVRWMFAKKLGTDGKVARYKSRLVVKGFMQRFGIEYQEGYAAVTSKATLRMFLGVSISNHLILRQLDIKTAFLNGELEQDLDIYMEQPKGFEVPGDLVCRLNKAIYGLKQAPRVWSEQLRKVVGQIGFETSVADPALYVRTEQDGSCTYILTYVDDFIIASRNLLMYHEIVLHMQGAGWTIT